MDSDERKTLDYIKENSSLIIEQMFAVAKINAALYEGYKNQGFTDEQAMELVKAHGMKIGG